MPKENKLHASALTRHIGFWMRLVSNHVSYAFARKLEASGVTVAEWVILRKMYSEQATTSPSAVAELTGLTRGAVSKLISRLLTKNLVKRQEGTTDRRFQDIQLTSAAIKLVPKLAKLADINDEEFFSILTGKERKELLDILRKTAEKHTLTKMPIS